MSKTIVKTEHAPAAIGPYSQAVRVGQFVYTAGQIPLDPATATMVENDITDPDRALIAQSAGRA